MPAILPPYRFGVFLLFLSYFVITHQLLHKQTLKYFMTNKCVVSLFTPFVYGGFSTASDYTILCEICVINSNIKIKYFLFN